MGLTTQDGRLDADRDLTKVYWDHYNVSDWKPGSRWTHMRTSQSDKTDIVGKVIDVDPPHRLTVTWALSADENDETKHSQVTYKLKVIGSDTKLTIIHSNLEPDSTMLRGISMGWPAVLSNLKTRLETGRTLLREMWSSVEDYDDFGL